MSNTITVASGTGCGRSLPGGFVCRHSVADHSDMHEGMAFSVVIECAVCVADAMGWHNAHLPCAECEAGLKLVRPKVCRESEEHEAFATHPFESSTVTISIAAPLSDEPGQGEKV